ncbi:transposase [Paraburkholderia youngii]|uniref:transposase n=1 Tax=Paraburkholderia youngii TaxID=2782701 RepID=UPI003D1A0A3E
MWTQLEPIFAQFRPPGAKVRTDRAALGTVLYVLANDVAWDKVPLLAGTSGPTAWQRFRHWRRSGAWDLVLPVLLRDLAPREAAALRRAAAR